MSVPHLTSPKGGGTKEEAFIKTPQNRILHMTINELSLAKNLTHKTNDACVGLEHGTADILELVTPTTAELLTYWFGIDHIETRDFNFHEGQKQAILNIIYAHEVLKTEKLQDLYASVAPDVLFSHTESKIITAHKNHYPKYCMKMATGTGKTWVLQALMIWQILNANRDANNTRFTKNFLVVAPGLIVYDRLLDAFIGKNRDFKESDIYRFQDLFAPDSYRDEIFRFVQNSVCEKENIGRKITSGGLIAICNWHTLNDAGDEYDDEYDNEIITPATDKDPADVVRDLLPLSPGLSTGNDLNTLNRRYEKGGILAYLSDLPSLMVFNDEAHHIHEVKIEGETTEVEWQKSLIKIATPKQNRFIQVDFSATPYNQVGVGKNKKLAYFAHIIVDFDLKTALRLGLVKAIVLDKRREVGALSNDELDFKAIRDEDNNPTLSEGQRIMLRAGFTKLQKLEHDFTNIDANRHPKMLVMCEDTSVTPLVEEFFIHEGLNHSEILRVDSDKKGNMKPDDWKNLKNDLFNMDKHKNPRVIVSVLMLREGFDVNNVCVIVPLRSSSSNILLEQTIGRGLRLMWRDNEYEDIKQENRKRIANKEKPNSLIDVLSIVEHPRFQDYYDELMREGLAGETDDNDDNGTQSTGDLISVGLKSDYEKYDFKIPFIIREAEEELSHKPLSYQKLPVFDSFTLIELKKLLGKGDVFISQDIQTNTIIGDYRIHGRMMNATGYNDYLMRIVKRISDIMNQPMKNTGKKSGGKILPHLQINKPALAGLVDGYIKNKLFGTLFNPLIDENWRVLLIDTVTEFIVAKCSSELQSAEENITHSEAEIKYRYLSEIEKITVRESFSIDIQKSIYPILGYPSQSGGFEKAFMEMANNDSDIMALCKINEQKHDFMKLRYLKDEGIPAFYHPDFLVRTLDTVYLVETKATGQMNNQNVIRKQKAAMAWCERINTLDAEHRMNCVWHYVLLGENVFYEWRDKNARLSEILEFAKMRKIETLGQQRLAI